MTCYNTRPYLPEAIQSVLDQTFTDFEFIIVNDGSTDESADYLDQLVDPRIKVIHQKNQGLGTPINKHLKMCRGELICRVDSDDYCYPTRLEKQVALLESSPELVAIGSFMKFFNDNGELKTNTMPIQHADILEGMLKGWHTMAHATMMFRRSLLDKIDGYVWSGVGEDWGLQLDAAKHGKLGMVPEPLYKMRLHSTSTAWTGAARVFLGFDFAIKRYRQWEKGQPESTEAEFLQDWEKASFMRRMSVNLRAVSSTYYRQSMVNKLEGRSFAANLRMLAAALLYPPKLAGAIWKRSRGS
jgi:glycosyltransferase involved in cell wall biosynthesis